MEIILYQVGCVASSVQALQKIQSICARVASNCHKAQLIILSPKFLLPNFLPKEEVKSFLCLVQKVIINVPILINILDSDFFLVSTFKIISLPIRVSNKGFVSLYSIAGYDIDLYTESNSLNLDEFNSHVSLINLHAKKYSKYVIYLSKIGIENQRVFIGYSFVINPMGSLIKQFPGFVEHVEVLNVTQSYWTSSLTEERGLGGSGLLDFNPELLYNSILFSLNNYFQDAGLSHAVIGLSGGIDSSLAAVLLTDLLPPENIIGLYLPCCYNSELSNTCVHSLVQRLQLSLIEKNINSIYTSIHDLFFSRDESHNCIVQENIYARIRALALMTYSNKISNSIVISTLNKSELSVGYITLYGDTCGGYAPFKDLYKTQIYSLAYWRNQHLPYTSKTQVLSPMPIEILERAPTSELRADVLDSIDLPPYSELDRILECLFHSKPLPSEAKYKQLYQTVLDLVIKNSFKRYYVPIGPQLYSNKSMLKFIK